MHLPDFISTASSIQDILKDVQNFTNDHVTQTSPISGGNFTPAMGLAIIDPLAKFNERSFIDSRNI